MSKVDFEDVQGLLRFGYGKMTRVSYALVRVRNVAAAKSWLRSAPVTTAMEQRPPPKTALNIAFTAPGLRILGVPAPVIEDFSHEFRGGMAQESRARQLGDIGANDPANWQWGKPGDEPHAVVMFFAEPDFFDAFVRGLTDQSWEEAFGEAQWLQTDNDSKAEPFGFTDSISQPEIDWVQRRDPARAGVVYSNVAALGEFVLGYPNEYGKRTDRPLLKADATSAGLPAASEEPTLKDLGRNGTYLVLRHLDQDVRAFWQFLARQTGGDFAEAEKLGAKLVGRTRAGEPLAAPQKELIPGIDTKSAARNHFTFDGDPEGSRCPFGAHIRRVNPRNADFPQRPQNILRKLQTMIGFGPGKFRDDLTSPVRFHRIIRRGRKFGLELPPEQALVPASPDAPEHSCGLYFICLNANISRQFEFLQNAWITGTKFSGLTNESDPLLGNRAAVPGCPVTGNFTIPEEGKPKRTLSGLPQFVTVRGGAYFFLPGLRALQYIAGV